MQIFIDMSTSTTFDDKKCIKCGGELDTGGECTECGFDNHPDFNKDLKETEKPTAPIDQQDRPNMAHMNLRQPEVSMNPLVTGSSEEPDREGE